MDFDKSSYSNNEKMIVELSLTSTLSIDFSNTMISLQGIIHNENIFIVFLLLEERKFNRIKISIWIRMAMLKQLLYSPQLLYLQIQRRFMMILFLLQNIIIIIMWRVQAK